MAALKQEIVVRLRGSTACQREKNGKGWFFKIDASLFGDMSPQTVTEAWET